LFNAVGWCLYGTETQIQLKTKQQERNEKPIPNEQSYIGNRAEVSVEVDIKLPESNYIESLSIRRKATYVKGSQSPSSTDFVIYAYHGSERLRISDYSKFRDQFLPKDLIQFYLFDGEYVQHTATNSNLTINSGLRKLFNIEKTENVTEIIGNLVTDWYAQSMKMPKQNTRINDIEGEILRLIEKQNNEKQRMKDDEKDKADFLSQRNQLQEELNKTKDLQEVIVKFKTLEGQEKNIEQEFKRANEDYYSNILTNAYLINSKSILQDVNKLIDKEPKVKELPADVRQILLNRLLEKGKCVCGTHLEKGSPEEKNVIAQLNVAEKEERMDFLLDMSYRIPIMMSNTEQRENVISSKGEELKKIEDRRRKTRKEIEDISSQLPKGELDLTTYTEKMNKLVTLSDDIREFERNISTYKSNIQEYDTRIDKLKEERGKIQEKHGVANVIETNKQIGEYLKKIFERFNTEILDNIAIELETEINDLIGQNKKLHNIVVKITTENGIIDFQFTEKGSTEHYLTGGQNQLFGVIIMAAFVRIMDRRGRDKVPFVFMDNPFSSIDKEALEVASVGISDLFKNAQVILFTTNDRFDKILDGAREHIFTAMTLTNDRNNVKIAKVEGE
jgi:DNA sulfur modification protein DndD